jgi:hypothetical protein
MCYLETTSEFIFWEFHGTFVILIVVNLRCMLETKLKRNAIRKIRLFWQ